MARKFVILLVVFVALHVTIIVTMGPSPLGSFCGNLLQIVASGIAAAAAMMPPTGPDSIIAAGRCVAISGVMTPPFERMMASAPEKPSSPRLELRLFT